MPPGLITNSGAAVVPLGAAGIGVNGRVVVQIKSVANPGKFVGRLPGADADIDLKCSNAADPAAAPAASFGAAGIFFVEDCGCIQVSLSFGAGDSVYVVGMGSA